MRIPSVHFAALLLETEAGWRAHLSELFEQPRFILGPQLAAFEQEWAGHIGAKFTVGVGNGTDAINSLIVCIFPAVSTTKTWLPCANGMARP